ncbi:anhydro-N-acetylmuramic acid kinase [Ancylobacter dichloromethanicus]|uniref:Anhydro-N-acetylmuramic acid kinase n=1 Tax=Ancylobacter dichloromethanicus TaxID=518825 RepID=A0A9W6JAS5_9HYPH|nr:anhydro-N-acetylmuramic acid kinase [Ancylobacter dichloromethanicus]MBS7555783.1 anhydro-N-acetylmuramic acid kinase [Ancylobacter dichloromethanicus]GLK72858.1 anhydro-N-acetylmuramic acid kinase [Ancylobacter dichloromethanicus]
MPRPLKAIGLMSGTSLDGVDVALIETDGESVAAFGPALTFAYGEDDRALFVAALEAARTLTDRDARPGALAAAEGRLTERHAQALAAFFEQHPVHRDVSVIGFHGQTVLHRPEIRLTIQIGDGPGLARAVRAMVPPPGPNLVYDLRAADVAAGGQGAPLVPVYHRALAHGLSLAGPLLVLNLGGVANITYIDGEADPIACDTGPANALIDDFMQARTGIPLDRDGAAAAAGRVDEAALARLLTHPFFARRPPKSLDRNDFREWVTEHAGLDGMSVADGAATLTALTAACVGAVLPHLPKPPRTLIAAGGGAHNPTLLRFLRARLGVEVMTADAVGWSTDALEAQAFGFLAVRALRGLPLSFPTTTGVPRPITGGVIELPLPAA